MLYEAIIMLGIISFTITSCLSLNYKIVTVSKDIEDKIEKIILKKLVIVKDCDRICLIKKALHPLK